MVRWNNPDDKISQHFTVHEACYLPSWDVMHIPSEYEQENILAMAGCLEQIRSYLCAITHSEIPINVHCWIRPERVNAPGNPYHGQDYNAYVKGAPKSLHRYGKAVDWNPVGMDCNKTRELLVPKLVDFGCRMENLVGNWIHNDMVVVAPGGNRYFKP